MGPISPMFDPETVLLMRQVVDEVWVKAFPHYSALEPNQAAAAKGAIARVVLYYANLGLRDPLVLRGMTFGMVKRLVKA